MANNGKRGQTLGKAALAKTNTVSVEITGVYEVDRAKFLSLIQDLGVTFDGNNNVLSNDIKDNVTSHTASISSLNSTVGSHTTTLSVINNKILAIASVLGITFNVDGTLNSEQYSIHTHGYVDSDTADTSTGTGATVNTNKTTGVVN